MKIGFDAKRAFHNRSGLGNYSRDVIDGLSQDNKTDELFLFTPPPSNDSSFSIDNAQIITPPSGLDSWITAYWRSFSIMKEVNNLQLDIFHGLSNELPLTLNNSVKKVVTIHDLIFKRYPEWYRFIDRKIYDWKFKTACRNANKIIAISEQTKKDIIHFYGIKPDKITVVYQTCNDRFKKKASIEQTESVRKKYHLPAEFLLNVGTIEARKNAFNIVKALHIHQIKTPLIIIGRATKYAEQIEQYIHKNKLNHQIKILYNVSNEELPVFYQMAKIFIYPSTFEGFGIPIIEALYSKTPVITSQGSCFSEAGGKDSIYVEVGNIEALAEAILNLINDNERCKQMQIKGIEYVQRFNTKVVINDLYKVYQNLLNKGSVS